MKRQIDVMEHIGYILNKLEGGLLLTTQAEDETECG